jgi:hypothetical protein
MRMNRVFIVVFYKLIDKALLFDGRSIKQDLFECQGKTCNKMPQNVGCCTEDYGKDVASRLWS